VGGLSRRPAAIPYKKPLADEVLFGYLKAGGHVRVIVDKDEQGRDKLGFQFLDGPVTPKPEKLPVACHFKPNNRITSPASIPAAATTSSLLRNGLALPL
jgi:hypothetical protein